MSHSAKKQSADRKHGPTPDSDDNVMQILDGLRQVEAAQFVAHVAAGDVPVELFTQ